VLAKHAQEVIIEQLIQTMDRVLSFIGFCSLFSKYDIIYFVHDFEI